MRKNKANQSMSWAQSNGPIAGILSEIRQFRLFSRIPVAPSRAGRNASSYSAVRCPLWGVHGMVQAWRLSFILKSVFWPYDKLRASSGHGRRSSRKENAIRAIFGKKMLHLSCGSDTIHYRFMIYDPFDLAQDRFSIYDRQITPGKAEFINHNS